MDGSAPAPDLISGSIQALEERRARILASIGSIGDLRPGTVVETRTKCGRAGCRCGREGDPGHGPDCHVVFNSGGRQTSRSVPAAKAAAVRGEVAECRRRRRLTGELIQIGEQLSDARLPSAGPSARNAIRKKPARRSSSPPSKPRSPAS